MAYCEAVNSANLLSNGEDVQQSLRGVLAHSVPRVDEGAACHTAGSLQREIRRLQRGLQFSDTQLY